MAVRAMIPLSRVSAMTQSSERPVMTAWLVAAAVQIPLMAGPVMTGLVSVKAELISLMVVPAMIRSVLQTPIQP